MTYGHQVYSAYGTLTGVRLTQLNFWGSHTVVCVRHSRNIPLQPVTTHDIEMGYGTSKCPFCKGGELYGKFHKFRSWKKLTAALDEVNKSRYLRSK